MNVTHCRLCHSSRLDEVIDLGYHPLADTFLFKPDLKGCEPRYPLQVLLCRDCGHALTSYVVSPEERYQKHHYSYDSSNSLVSVHHFQELASQVIQRLSLSSEDLVVDVGSNIGTLLGHFKSQGISVYGIEPASNLAKLAETQGIPTVNAFFGQSSLKKISELAGIPRVITITNVLNHSEHLEFFFDEIRPSLEAGGSLVIEVPYLYDLVRQNAFDTIYLEHVNYFSLKPLLTYFSKKGLILNHVEKISYMGGSLRLYVSLFGHVTSQAETLVRQEEAFGLFDLKVYQRLMASIRQTKMRLNRELYQIKASGGKIIGIGAATKGNTFLNFCKIDSDLIEFITDQSSLKIGKLTPGSHIEIKSDDAITADITHALILPWNIASYLIKKLSHHPLQFLIPQVENHL